MKKIIIFFCIILFCKEKLKAQPPVVTSDTLQWLKTNIAQRSSYFIGKPLSVMLDSLYNLNGAIADYIHPLEVTECQLDGDTTIGDNIYSNRITIFLGQYYGGMKSAMHEFNQKVNTHIPYFYITFTQQIPFPIATINDRNAGTLFGSIEGLCRPYIVQSFTVGEY